MQMSVVARIMRGILNTAKDTEVGQHFLTKALVRRRPAAPPSVARYEHPPHAAAAHADKSEARTANILIPLHWYVTSSRTDCVQEKGGRKPSAQGRPARAEGERPHQRDDHGCAHLLVRPSAEEVMR